MTDITDISAATFIRRLAAKSDPNDSSLWLPLTVHQVDAAGANTAE